MNENIIQLIISAAHELSNRGDTNASLIPNRKALGISIIGAEYTRLLTQAHASKDGDEAISGQLVAKPGSWLSLIPLANDHSQLNSFNMSALDSSTMGKISNRFREELSHYNNYIMPKIKNYAYKIDSYVAEANSKTTTVADMLDIQYLTRPLLIDTLQEKRWLDRKELIGQDPIVVDLAELSTMTAKDITSDMELQMVVSEEIAGLTDTDLSTLDMLEHIVEIGAMETRIEALDITDIKALAVFIAKLRNLTIIRKDNEVEYVVNMAIEKLHRLDASYKSNLKINNIVCMYNRINTGKIRLFVISETYTDLEVKDPMILMGGVLKKTAGQNTMGRRMAVNLYRHEIIENEEIYGALANKFKDSIIMTNKNNAVSGLRDYYTFGIKGVMEADMSEIRAYVEGKPLHELSNVNKMCFNIVKDVVEKAGNFKLYAEYTEEALEILGDNIDKQTAMSYGAYKLSLMYFTRQCEVI